MATDRPPLSPTVIAVFDAFLQELSDEKTLKSTALEAVKSKLFQQRLDASSLREAMFAESEPKK